MPLTVNANLILNNAPAPESANAGQVRQNAKDKEVSVSFSDLMNQSIAAKQQPQQAGGASAQGTDQTLDLQQMRQQSPMQQDYERQSAPQQKPLDQKTDELSQETEDAAVQAVEDIAEGVAENVAEELDITDEQLAEVMETIGLTVMDLLNPQMLQQVVEAVQEQMPELELSLDAADIVAELIPQNEQVITEALNDNGISMEEFSQFFQKVNDGEIELPEEIVNLLPTQTPVNEEGEPMPLFVQQPEVRPQEQPAEAQTQPQMTMTETVQVIHISDDEMNAVSATIETTVPANAAVSEEAAVDTDAEAFTESVPLANTEEMLGEEAESFSQGFSEETGTNTGSGQQSSQQSSSAQQAVQTTANTMDMTAAQAFNPQTENTFAETLQEAQAQAPVTPYTTQQTADIMNQIVTQAATTITDTVSRMEMELNPQNLGRMIMQVQQQEGVVTARLIAQNENVRAALETQLAQLRESLEARGIRVDAVEVTVGTHEFERNLEEGMAQQFADGQQTQEGREGGNENRGRTRNLNRSELDDLEGELTEEEELAAAIMRDTGGTVDYTA
ncbi:MAG: flagellar hook-length control protein FliK [Lachnospiraceae bacterium]|nr:flagellar hook-length control protein FliK [Lachnospiraceae bacterium]